MLIKKKHREARQVRMHVVLAVLIIDQGSIIDRIDYNMEKTAEQTAQGRDELGKAERSHRRSPAMCCIMP